MKIRNKIVIFYSKYLPLNESALIAGMTIGSKRGISKEFWESLTLSGTAHVVVASGTNVVLTSGFILSLFSVFVRRKVAILVAILTVWIYVLFCGMEAPIVRAGVMTSVVFLSQVVGRKAHTLRILILTGLIMLLVKPLWLTDLGFILTFAATLGLILFVVKIYRLLSFVPKLFREGLATSLAAQILVAPVLLFSFGKLNFFSPLVNSLVLWTVGPITAIGMVSAIVSLVSVKIGSLVLLITYPLARYFIFVVNLAT